MKKQLPIFILILTIVITFEQTVAFSNIAKPNTGIDRKKKEEERKQKAFEFYSTPKGKWMLVRIITGFFENFKSAFIVSKLRGDGKFLIKSEGFSVDEIDVLSFPWNLKNSQVNFKFKDSETIPEEIPEDTKILIFGRPFALWKEIDVYLLFDGEDLD